MIEKHGTGFWPRDHQKESTGEGKAATVDIGCRGWRGWPKPATGIEEASQEKVKSAPKGISKIVQDDAESDDLKALEILAVFRNINWKYLAGTVDLF